MNRGDPAATTLPDLAVRQLGHQRTKMNSFYMHPKYQDFLGSIKNLESDARVNPNALNLAFDVWLLGGNMSESKEQWLIAENARLTMTHGRFTPLMARSPWNTTAPFSGLKSRSPLHPGRRGMW